VHRSAPSIRASSPGPAPGSAGADDARSAVVYGLSGPAPSMLDGPGLRTLPSPLRAPLYRLGIARIRVQRCGRLWLAVDRRYRAQTGAAAGSSLQSSLEKPGRVAVKRPTTTRARTRERCEHAALGDRQPAVLAVEISHGILQRIHPGMRLHALAGVPTMPLRSPRALASSYAAQTWRRA